MTVKGHILLAAPIAYAVNQMLQISDTEALIAYAFGALIGVTLPDIDEPESYIGSRFYGLAFVVKKLNRHRGITHSVWAILLPFVLAIGLKNYFFFGLSVGIMAHIVGDMITNSGIRGFFGPIYKGKIVLLPQQFRFQTGGIVEYMIIFLLFFLNCFLVLGLAH